MTILDKNFKVILYVPFRHCRIIGVSLRDNKSKINKYTSDVRIDIRYRQCDYWNTWTRSIALKCKESNFNIFRASISRCSIKSFTNNDGSARTNVVVHGQSRALSHIFNIVFPIYIYTCLIFKSKKYLLDIVSRVSHMHTACVMDIHHRSRYRLEAILCRVTAPRCSLITVVLSTRRCISLLYMYIST